MHSKIIILIFDFNKLLYNYTFFWVFLFIFLNFFGCFFINNINNNG